MCWNEWVASSFLRVKSDTDTHHGSVTTPVPYANLDVCGILNLIDLICLTSLLYEKNVFLFTQIETTVLTLKGFKGNCNMQVSCHNFEIKLTLQRN